jgi:lipid II:glycine glycyltransferase (peptidoglycan interpeptide bridge formation enzyme)
MADFRQTSQYGKYLEAIGWVVEKIDSTLVFIRKIPLTPFSIIKIQRANKLPDLKKVQNLARKYRSFSVSIEPSVFPGLAESRLRSRTRAGSLQSSVFRLKKNNYRLSKSPYLPTKTIHLDLTQPKKKLFAQMKKDVRYSLKKINRPDYNILVYNNKTEQEIKNFYQAWKKTAGWQMLIPSFKNIRALKKCFGQNALFLASKSSEIIAGTIILMADQAAYYYYAFTSKKGRKLLAQYGLVWEAIKLAKKRGCQVFDFEGIYDPRFPVKSWLGFSHFKKSFGGKEIDYPGCFKRKIL